MEFRSQSCGKDSYFQVGGDSGAAGSRIIPNCSHDLRSHSVHYAAGADTVKRERELKMTKVKTVAPKNSSSDFWGFSDPELQRLKRLAGYKVYAVEGKMKGYVKKSFKWVKNTCSHLVYRWR